VRFNWRTWLIRADFNRHAKSALPPEKRPSADYAAAIRAGDAAAAKRDGRHLMAMRRPLVFGIKWHRAAAYRRWKPAIQACTGGLA